MSVSKNFKRGVIAFICLSSLLLLFLPGEITTTESSTSTVVSHSTLSPSVGTWQLNSSAKSTIFQTKFPYVVEKFDSLPSACENEKKKDECFVWKRKEREENHTKEAEPVHIIPSISSASRFFHANVSFFTTKTLDSEVYYRHFTSAYGEGVLPFFLGLGYLSKDTFGSFFDNSTPATIFDLSRRRMYSDRPLNISETIRLFSYVYEKRLEKNQTSKILDKECLWLANLSFSTGHVSGQMWSTCGDKIDLNTSVPEAAQLSRGADILLRIFGVSVCIPSVFGFFSQYKWIMNSRGRVLNMNFVQLIVICFWEQMLRVLVYSIDRVVVLRRSTLFFFQVSQLFTLIITVMLMVIYLETSQYLTSPMTRTAVLLFIVVILSIVAVLIPLNVCLIVVPPCFWLPQIVQNTIKGNWNSFTHSFIIANFLSFVIPCLIVLCALPPPWKLKQEEKLALLSGIFWVSIVSFFLVSLKIIGRLNLPSWVMPWRHRYKTSVAEQRASLSEHNICAICNSSLTEAWDDNDELWVTPCHHLFHKNCLERWMLEQMQCPLCRSDIPEP